MSGSFGLLRSVQGFAVDPEQVMDEVSDAHLLEKNCFIDRFNISLECNGC